MKSTSFLVRGSPKGQPRPRAFAFHGKARVYDPGTAEGWKGCIAVAVQQAGMPKFGDAALLVHLCFVFRRPKSHYGAKGLKPSAPKHYVKKPDRDNLDKAVCDALTTLGVWDDDCQVIGGQVAKCWAAIDEPEGCHIRIEEVE